MARPDPPLPLRRVASPAEAEDLFAMLRDEAEEVAAFAYLDGEQRLLGLRHFRSAAQDRLDFPIRAIALDALTLDAVAVVMAHNHPSGDATPSPADRAATVRMARALDGIGITLADHLVMTRDGMTSFRSLGLL